MEEFCDLDFLGKCWCAFWRGLQTQLGFQLIEKNVGSGLVPALAGRADAKQHQFAVDGKPAMESSKQEGRGDEHPKKHKEVSIPGGNLVL